MKKGKTMSDEQRMDRRTQLTERLKHLLELKEGELNGEKSENYISDLNDSIAGCERELSFLHKNPGGVEYVNGG